MAGVMYRNVELFEHRIAAEYTTTEPVECFPDGYWSRFTSTLVEWWARQVIVDNRANDALKVLLDTDGDVIDAVRSASPYAQAGLLWVLAELTGLAGPAALLGVTVDDLQAAIARVDAWAHTPAQPA